MALSLAVGVGVTVFPYAFQDQRASPYTSNFWPCTDCSDTLKGFRNGLMIFLSTGYCIGTVIAMALNFILPADAEVVRSGDVTGKTVEVDETEKVYVRETVSRVKMLGLPCVIMIEARTHH
jgi:xanthine/uracil permease